MKELFSAGGFFKVIEKNVYLKGKKHVFYFIDIKDVVVIAALNDKKEIIIERHFRPSINKYIYEMPAGYVEKGEKPIEAAKRELEEETGYKTGRIKNVFTNYISIGRTSQKAYIFLADRLKKGRKKEEAGEIIEYIKFISIEEAAKMIERQTMGSEFTATAMYLYSNRDKLIQFKD